MSQPPTERALSAWFATPPGRYMQAWEIARLDETVADIFGFNALQLGLPELLALKSNRMPHQWVAVPDPSECLPVSPVQAGPGGTEADAPSVALVAHAAALPFPAASVDLIVLPHTLELSADPHAVLREVERVLVPEGRVIVVGFNPLSLWGWRQQLAHVCKKVGLLRGTGRLFLPEADEFISPWRLKDWLRLLSFEVQSADYGCYRPAVRTEPWLHRFRWMDRVGARWWPFLGAVYFVVAVKRVRGMHLLGPAWKPRRAVAAPAAVAQKTTPHSIQKEPTA